MKTKTKVALACIAFVCVALGGLLVEAAPPRPASFYGTVKVNGVNPPTWVSVEARIDDVTYASTPVQIVGIDTVYALDVPGDVPELVGKQGGTAGEAIQFWVGGLLCGQAALWQEGAHTNLNLTASGVLPTATPTDTVVPTDTPTITPTPTDTPAVTPTPVILNLGPANTTVKDTYLSKWVTDENYGGGALGQRLRVYASDFRSMVYFDTSSIPTDATLFQASLHLYLDSYEHRPDIVPNVGVYRVVTDWEELQATWNHRLTEVSWASAGCDSAADRDTTPVSSALIEGVSLWYQWPLTSLVQEWVWHPTSNKGVILINPLWRDLRFHSSDCGHNMPYLHVEYTVGAGPGPTETVTPTETPSVAPTPALVEIHDASQDSYISNIGEQATQNFENYGLRVMAGYSTKRSLLDFDVISRVPPGVEIVSAALRLTASNLDDGHTDRTMPIGAYLVHRPWVANQVTWQEAETGTGWTLPGCDGVPGDRSGTPSGTTTVLEISTGTHPWQRAVYDWDVTSIVQAWIDAPGDQAGLVLVGHDAYREIGFYDSAYSIEDMHPVLLVQWRPRVTPTPTLTLTPTPGLGTVQGIVFVDLNVDGVRDPGEPGMIGVSVQLFSGPTLVGLQNTPGSGTYSFGGHAPGTYTVNIVVPDGYASSTQNPQDVSVLSGQVTQADFGIYPISRLYFAAVRK